MKSKKPQQMVERFSKVFIFSHWLYAISFFGLLITGLPMWTDFFNWLYPVVGGPASGRFIHRIFAIMFMMPPILLLLFDREGLKRWGKGLISWKKHDFQFFLGFPKDFFGFHAEIPKQDFYNAGEKLNSLLQIFSFFILVISGFMMWFPNALPKAVQIWGYPLHDIGFSLAIAVVVGHVYLSIGHPASRPSITGMTKGVVPIEYAKAHHGRWYDELQQKSKTGTK